MSKFIKLQICFMILLIYGRRCLATNMSTSSFIFGGTDAKLEEIYFLVSICFRKGPSSCKHICGGSVITQRAVITAAHCVESRLPPNYFNLIMGILRRSKNTKHTLQFKIKKIIVHENFDSMTLENDIAIYFAKDRIPHDHFVHPIKLPEYEAGPNSTCKIFGWGKTDTFSSDCAKKATVQLIYQNECVSAYSKLHKITSGMICAANKKDGADACQGDSGGPLISNDTLIGIVSFGVGCADPDYPGVYTAIWPYRVWINKTLRNSSECNAFSILYIILITEMLKFIF